MTHSDFDWKVRVYYEDTDSGGVVYYANYLKFFERARTEWLRAKGIDHNELAAVHCVAFAVQGLSVDYHAPARLDDELKLSTTVERFGRASIQFIQEAWRISGDAPKLLASCRIKVVCVNLAVFRACPIPGDVVQKINPAG